MQTLTKLKNGTFNIVGCTPTELKTHIEKQFSEGMNWENYGFTGWHIDHDVHRLCHYRLCHYTNLQPMWSEDN